MTRLRVAHALAMISAVPHQLNLASARAQRRRERLMGSQRWEWCWRRTLLSTPQGPAHCAVIMWSTQKCYLPLVNAYMQSTAALFYAKLPHWRTGMQTLHQRTAKRHHSSRYRVRPRRTLTILSISHYVTTDVGYFLYCITTQTAVEGSNIDASHAVAEIFSGYHITSHSNLADQRRPADRVCWSPSSEQHDSSELHTRGWRQHSHQSRPPSVAEMVVQ